MNWEMFEIHRFKHLSPPFVSVTFPIAPALKVGGVVRAAVSGRVVRT
jgi:hypothetical protein